MLSPQERERKKGVFAKALRSGGKAQTKKYMELYADFSQMGYTRELADGYADAFVNDQKKPLTEDIIQTAILFDRVRDFGSAEFYLDMLKDKKLGNDDKFAYCIEMLKVKSKQGHWRDAVDFRTENINFMQNYSKKVDMKHLAEMYIALALVDCASKKYMQAFKLLTNFGYKPQGQNDATLVEICITCIYICAKSGDRDSVASNIENAHGALKLFTEFEHPWLKAYYEKLIEDASQGIV